MALDITLRSIRRIRLWLYCTRQEQRTVTNRVRTAPSESNIAQNQIAEQGSDEKIDANGVVEAGTTEFLGSFQILPG